MAELSRLLRNTRLLTLTGSAGVGKTRLASELAGRVRRSYPAGVCVAELAPVADAGLVVPTVAAAMKVGEQPGVPPVATLLGALADRHLLLVLDNCEHLVQICGELVAALLRDCPQLTVLAASREALGLSGETVYEVGGLGHPDVAATTSVADMLGSEAVQLFVDRAHAALPDFALNATNATAIGMICRRLDGVPLAIELAARMVRVFPPAQLAAHMDDRLSLLVLGDRTAPEQHRSLRAAIEWSYRLLPLAEQEAFRRLSVFTAGFDADAAAAIIHGEDSPVAAVHGVLAGLEAKSLISAALTPAGSTRLRMLESIRLYAWEQLCAHDGEDETVERLVGWLTHLSRPLLDTAYLSNPIQDRLDAEHDTLTQVLDRMPSGTDDRQLLLASALAEIRIRRGDGLDDIGDRLIRTLETANPSSTYRSLALNYVSQLAERRGDSDEAVRLAEQAIALERRYGRPVVHARLLRTLADALRCGDIAGLDTAIMKLAQRCRLRGDKAGEANFLQDLAWNAIGRGDLADAGELLDHALAILRTDSSPADLGVAEHTAGTLALAHSDLTSAEAYFTASLANSVAPSYVSDAVEGLAIVAARTGRPERGLRLIAAARAIRATFPSVDEPWWNDWLADAAAVATAALPSHGAAAATAAGAGLGLWDTVEYALHDTWPDPDPAGLDASHDQRESQVLRLIAEGLTSGQIASRLDTSLRTVDAEVRRIRVKLGLRSRAHIAAWLSDHMAAL